MNRGAPVAIAAALGALWLCAVALHLDLVARGRLAWLPLYVTPAADAASAPAVAGFWPETPQDAGGLRIGDRLLSARDRSLAGAGRLDALARIHRDARKGVARLRVQRDGAEQELRFALQRFEHPWSQAPLVLGMGLGALAIWLRARESRAARASALAMWTYSLHWAISVPGGGWRTHAGFWLLVGSGALFGPLTLRALLLFGESPRGRPRWQRVAPWAFLAIGPLLSSWILGAPLPGRLGLSLLLGAFAALVGCVLLALATTYARADAPTRRQLRFVVLGLYLGLAPVGAAAALAAWQPAWRPAYEASLLATLAIPACIAVALTRHQLFDIDRLISSTAAYSLLLILFLSLLVVPVPVAAGALSQWAGVDRGLVQWALALVLATGVILGERSVRPRLERLFFRERFVLERGVRDLRASLASADGPGPLFERLGARLSEMLGLRSCIAYARAGERLAPIWAQAPLVPPGFEARGRLAALLEEAGAPVDDARWRRWGRRGLLDPLELQELLGIDARLLLPVSGEKGLLALLCLGEKGSEDVYTPVDLALLEGLADRAALELARFDAAAIERAERERYQRLAGYVPAPVRDELLARSIEAEPGEREVSVLFVDIRGYTALSEGRTPDEIFRVVNAYTTAVSRVVREHHGFVVEFQGDGLMAVFGAPRPLARKEQAAVEAALAVVEQVERRGIPELASLPLRVGVGVATGPAYVGNVQSVDRKIWCVIGNTTNLAARLQAMTRELGVALLIDDATWRRAGDAVQGFEVHELRVRGRSEHIVAHASGAGAAC
jgi:class 3 adenylate cyclase